MTRTPADVPNAPAGNKRLADVIVRLRGADYPLAAGLVAAVGVVPSSSWRDFEWLIGHAGSAVLRSPFARIRKLKPAQIADLPVVDDERRLLGVMAAPPDTRHGNAR